MKRGKPLARGKGLERRSELKADVERVREFMARGRQELDRAKGMRRKMRDRAQEGPLTPAAWREAVFQSSGGTCILSGARAPHADDRRFAAHHPLPKRELRARGLYGWVWDPRNGAWVAAEAHERHENASRRIPAERLPASVWEFCGDLDRLAGSEWATELVLRAHPARGDRGRSR